uniref:Quinone oxidoreductase PIG3 n=1 Tax=Aegilops tauschii TaxID=37682 RepID=N1QU16_AEGTA
MRAVAIASPGGPEVLEEREVEDLAAPGDGEVLLGVAAAGVNRTDTVQRQGGYPAPSGASPYPGVECSGSILALGANVHPRWAVGDQVCALLNGGGYAEKVVVPAALLLPVPEGVSLTDAAGLPEVACTVWSTVFMTSHLSPGESFLIHGGSSGIGTFAIQIAKHLGIKVFVTAGSEEKLAACAGLGADVCINYKTEEFVARIKEETNGKGVDVILDNVGGPYLQRNLDSLAVDVAGLRSRSLANKAQIVSEVEKNVWPAVASGKVKPVVYKTLPLSEAAEAHKLMESSSHIGKILLIP